MAYRLGLQAFTAVAQVQSLVVEQILQATRCGRGGGGGAGKVTKEPNGNPGVQKYSEIKFILKKRKRKPFCKLGIAKRNKHLQILVPEWVEG